MDSKNGFVASKIEDFKADAKRYFDTWGEGSRAIIGAFRNDGSGHAISAKIVGKNILFVDSQSGNHINIDNYLSSVDSNKNIFIVRVDNINPKPTIASAIERRR